MSQFALPTPLTKWNAVLAEWYERRYSGIDISEARKAWRGQHEIDRGRVTVEKVIDDLARLRFRFTLTEYGPTGPRFVREFCA